MGGPNISVDADSRIELLRRHRDVCVYVLGEGDLAAPRIVRQWLQDGCSTEKLLERDLGGCVQRRPDGSVTGDAFAHLVVERLGGGDDSDRTASVDVLVRPPLGECALARPGAAEQERERHRTVKRQ